jgi:hypothetical protein
LTKIEVENTNGRIFDIKFDPATKEIEEEVLGTLSITRLSWLGQLRCKPGTFDKAAIDVSQVLCARSLCCIIAFALVRRADFAVSVAYEMISNDQDVMDYSLNKASEELLKTLF